MTTEEPPFDEISPDEADLEELCIPLEAEADDLPSTVVISVAMSPIPSPSPSFSPLLFIPCSTTERAVQIGEHDFS
ncbi:MAG: hypothetical protein GY835_28510 [bacterium]|nr:hypothetical protein [bacterium]